MEQKFSRLLTSYKKIDKNKRGTDSTRNTGELSHNIEDLKKEREESFEDIKNTMRIFEDNETENLNILEEQIAKIRVLEEQILLQKNMRDQFKKGTVEKN